MIWYDLQYLSYSISVTFSLYLPILATIFLCTHLICFPSNAFLIPSFHSLFPLTLILHRYHIDYAVMILICWWSWLITILTYKNIEKANFVWIALKLVGLDLIMSHLFYCNLICYIYRTLFYFLVSYCVIIVAWITHLSWSYWTWCDFILLTLNNVILRTIIRYMYASVSDDTHRSCWSITS